MTNVADQDLKWAELTKALTDIAREYNSSSVFLSQVLRMLKERTGCLRVTYLCSSPNEETGKYIVTGETCPADKSLIPLNAEKLSIFGEKIIIESRLDKRFYERKTWKEGTEYLGRIIQFDLHERGEQYTLSLTYDSNYPETITTEEQERALNFVAILAHFVNSKVLSEAERLRETRLKAIREILSQIGTVKEVAQKVCSIWRDWLKVPAVRLWEFNSEFHELDLLYACFDEQYEKHFETSSNRLSSSSIGASAISKSAVIRVEDPASRPEWDVDPGLTDLLKVLPQMICIPLISADSDPNDSTKPRFVGLLDLHVRDISSVDQPDNRILFLGTITAAALLRARSFERYEIIRKLSQIAIELVNPKDLRRLSERKEEYLNKVKNVILQAVNARCVSIFEADESRDIIRCVATTGIQGEEDFEKTVFYRANEGLTWEVFATGKHKVLSNVTPSHCQGYKGKFREERTLPVTEGYNPHLIFPLPGQTPEAATGVIRIVERTCSIYKNRLQNFSDHDIDLIKLITYQVSPALQMIRMQAHRELFVERTAHQIIQPLQGVIAYISNILDGLYEDDPEKKREKFQYIRQMARAVVGMMRSTMWASRVTDFSFLNQVYREPVKLTAYFIERIIDLQPIRAQEHIRVSFVNPEEADTWGKFLVDEQFFEQVVQNLLHNAVKYSYPRTKVEVKVQRNNRELCVLISSTGVPINPEEQDRMFGDRVRGTVASRYDPHGTGQGLHIARQIMRGFGGDVLLLSTAVDKRVVPPQGFPTAQRSTFMIIYPEAFPK